MRSAHKLFAGRLCVTRHPMPLSLMGAVLFALLTSACPSEVPSVSPAPHGEVLADAGDAEGGPSPEVVLAERNLFTTRCSKCHSLARILEIGFRDETFWRRYVHRMRLQPASGISEEEEAPLLRHLMRLNEEKRPAGATSK